jgi:hypothetical protein
MKAYSEMGIELIALLTSTLDGDECSALPQRKERLVEIVHDTGWTGWVPAAGEFCNN